MAGTVIQAFIFRDGDYLGTEMITGERIELGRDLSCDLVVEDEQVSRHHARLQVRGGQLYLEDLGSANGTMVNGERVKAAKVLSARDDVFLGRHVIKFKILSASPRAAAPAPAPAPIPAPNVTTPSLRPQATAPIPGAAAGYTPDATLPDGIPRGASGSHAPPLAPQPIAPGPMQQSFDSPSGMHQPRSDPWKDLSSSPSGGSDPVAPGAPPPPPVPGLGKADPLELEDELFSDLTNIPGHSSDPLALDFEMPPPPPDHDDQTLADGALPASARLADAFFPNDVPLDEVAREPVGGGFDAMPPAPPAVASPPELTEPARAPTADLLAAVRPPRVEPNDAPTRAAKMPRLTKGGGVEGAVGMEPLPPSPAPPPPPLDFDDNLDLGPSPQLAKAPPVAKGELLEPEPPLRRPPPPIDDEDYDPDDEPAPFSLFENLLKEKFKDGRVKQVRSPVLEVVRYHENVVKDMVGLGRGQIYTVGAGLKKSEAQRVGIPANFKLAKLRRDGAADLVLLQAFKGRVVQQGSTRTLQDAATWKGEKGSLRLAQGDLANLQIGPDQYFVRFAFPPALLREVTRRGRPSAEQRRERRWTVASFGSSIGAHFSVLLVLFIAGLISPPQLVTQLEEDRFVQLEMKELELEKPPEEEPEQEAEEAPEEEAPPEDIKKPPKRLTNPTAEKKKPGILAALGKIPQRAGPAGSQTLTAAVSNLDAVKVPGGGASYKVTGLIGKGPTNRVRIGGAGGGVATKGLASILREGGGGPGRLSKLKGGSVRGRLVKASRGSKMKGTGYLDRAEIQKVVNKGLGQIQFCYEKELLKNQSLSGKVVFEWTIAITGKVSIVKTTTSTLQSPAAVTCMINAIKGWKFPAPRGGTVIVTYPFIFNAMGF